MQAEQRRTTDLMTSSRYLLGVGSLAIGGWGLIAPGHLARVMGDDLCDDLRLQPSPSSSITVIFAAVMNRLTG